MANSRTFKAGILGLSKFLIRISGIVSAAVLARLLTKLDYAAYRQTILAYHFVEPLMVLGLSQALFYFIPRDREHSRSILSGNLLMLFSMGLVFALAMWLGGNELLAARFNNPALKRLLLIYSPYAMLALPLSTVGACLLSFDRVKTLAVYEIISRVVGIVLVVAFVLIRKTPAAAVAGVLAGTAIMFLPGLRLMYRAASSGSWLPSFDNMRGQIKFGVPLGLASLIEIISINLDKLLVSSFFSPEQFAVYVNGAMEIPVIGIITGSVVAVLIPEFVVLFKVGDTGEIIALWQRAMVKCAMILFPIMLFLMALAPEVISVVFSEKYLASSVPFRIYLLLIPVRITHFGALIMAAGKSHWILFKSLSSVLINLILSLLFIRWLGYLGPAIATITTIYLWNVNLNVYLISRLYKQRATRLFPWSKLATLSILAFLPVLVIWLLKRSIPVDSRILAILFSLIIYLPSYLLLLIWSGFISTGDLKSMVVSVRRKIFGR